jgi:hypothetical protein
MRTTRQYSSSSSAPELPTATAIKKGALRRKLAAAAGSSELGACAGMREAALQVEQLPGASDRARAAGLPGSGAGSSPGHRAPCGQALQLLPLAAPSLKLPGGQPTHAVPAALARHRGSHTSGTQSVAELSVALRPGALGCVPGGHTSEREMQAARLVPPTPRESVPGGHWVHGAVPGSSA